MIFVFLAGRRRDQPRRGEQLLRLNDRLHARLYRGTDLLALGIHFKLFNAKNRYILTDLYCRIFICEN